MIWQPHVSVGYLDQYADIDRHLTIRTFLKSAFSNLYAVERKMMQIYESFENGHSDMQLLNQAAEYQKQLENSVFYQIDTQIEQVASGLGLLTIGLDRPIDKISGGQRAKVILAKLCLKNQTSYCLTNLPTFWTKSMWSGFLLCYPI